jgi:hypothetical protein
LNEENDRIITCDRDEKIRIAKFPDAHEIMDFKLGHKEAVVNISIVNNGFNVLSISAVSRIVLLIYFLRSFIR